MVTGNRGRRTNYTQIQARGGSSARPGSYAGLTKGSAPLSSIQKSCRNSAVRVVVRLTPKGAFGMS